MFVICMLLLMMSPVDVWMSGMSARKAKKSKCPEARKKNNDDGSKPKTKDEKRKSKECKKKKKKNKNKKTKTKKENKEPDQQAKQTQ